MSTENKSPEITWMVEKLPSSHFRAGNIAKILYFGIDKSKPISKSHNCTLYQSEIKSSDWYEPTPLTEEWLLAFGFRKDIANIYHAGGLAVYHGPKWKDEGYRLYGQFALEKVTIQYVHQLQNLYFALTGVELPIPKYLNRIK